jgi:formylglycine-generating enzyme required for sulfatase activity
MPRLLIRFAFTGFVSVLLMAPAFADTKGVTVEGKAPADYFAAQTGQSWAVVIGIDEYEQAPKLKYAVADAKSVASMLAQRGFQVSTLYDKQATKGAIEEELGDKLLTKVKKQDRVLIFYSGHGETRTVEGGKTQGFLLPVGGRQEALTRSGISMGAIRELADALPAKQVLFLVDVCYGGIAGTQFKSPSKYNEAYLKTITKERGRQLIAAGGPEQQALEGPEWGHSVFTYYLLKGLEDGAADLNDDGIIPTSELHTYLERRVFDEAQMKGHTQRPELWALAAERGEFVFFTSTRPLPSPPPRAGEGRPVLSPGEGVGEAAPSAELAAERQRLEAERRQMQAEREAVERERRQAEERARLDAERRHLDEERQKLEVARARPYEAPRQMGREITGKDGTPMVLVPEGEFLYGDNKQRISLSAFYMDLYEVTTGRYAAFLQATGRSTPSYWDEVRPISDGELPVVGVNWEDADAYCRWAGKRLPTDQEWEKAARGTDGRGYPWGNAGPTPSLANYGQSDCWLFCNVYAEKLKPVNSYKGGRSPYGIYNMAGNVWEWVEEKVLRGGSWALRAGWGPSGRLSYQPTARLNDLGFRCAQGAS